MTLSPARIEAAARAIETAARAICEADPLSPSPDAPIIWNMKPAKAWEPRAAILRAAIDAGLFCHPPKAWLAPHEATEAMELSARDALQIGDRTILWHAFRDAHLKEIPD